MHTTKQSSINKEHLWCDCMHTAMWNNLLHCNVHWTVLWIIRTFVTMTWYNGWITLKSSDFGRIVEINRSLGVHLFCWWIKWQISLNGDLFVESLPDFDAGWAFFRAFLFLLQKNLNSSTRGGWMGVHRDMVSLFLRVINIIIIISSSNII